MKYLDEVKVITNNYEKHGIKKGAIGNILFAEIRQFCFYVVFTLTDGTDYADEWLHVKDLELYKSYNMTDEAILKDLPKHDPNWWCKVEDGYILNLKGEKKNKVAYDYDS